MLQGLRELFASLSEKGRFWPAARQHGRRGWRGAFPIAEAIDIVACAPTSLGDDTACNPGLYWNGGIHGISGGNLGDFALVLAAGMGGAQAITWPAEHHTEAEGMRDIGIHLPFVAAR